MPCPYFVLKVARASRPYITRKMRVPRKHVVCAKNIE
jgi:hypothetical protein